MADVPCTHHWLIASPDGPWVEGRCKLCGEERTFPSTAESSDWASDPAETAAVRRQRAGQAGATATAKRKLSSLAQTAEFYADLGVRRRTE